MPEFSSAGTFALVTLGCKVNQYESQALREAWLARGLFETASLKDADIVCINSCAVTAKAVADLRAVVRRAHRAGNKTNIIITGCAAQVLGETLQGMPGVVLVVPQSAKSVLLRVGEEPPLLDSMASTWEKLLREASLRHVERDTCYPPLILSDYDRSRAVLKTQDGCSHRCTYCIVPFTRGASCSRDMRESLAEAKRLLAAGFREITINGINLAQYGRDLSPPCDFWDLVHFLDKELSPEWKGLARLRLSSLDPGQLNSKAIEVLGKSVLVAPHLHISLQSASRDVLRRMGRTHYDPGVLAGFCNALTDVFPQYGLGADILTGFPGELQEQADETELFCESLPFTYAHVFPYSRRPGTAAAAWPDQVQPAAKKERAARLRAVFIRKKTAFLEQCLKLPRVHVVCESFGKNATGVNEYYTDCRIVGSLPVDSRKELTLARPVGIDGNFLLVQSLHA